MIYPVVSGNSNNTQAEVDAVFADATPCPHREGCGIQAGCGCHALLAPSGHYVWNWSCYAHNTYNKSA